MSDPYSSKHLDIKSIEDMAKKLSMSDYTGSVGMKEPSIYRNVQIKWELRYRNSDVVNHMDHQAYNLKDVLKQFERFCKGCGYEFAGFAVVDEDGIPVNGLNPMARLESEENEEGSI